MDKESLIDALTFLKDEGINAVLQMKTSTNQFLWHVSDINQTNNGMIMHNTTYDVIETNDVSHFEIFTPLEFAQ